MKRLIVILLFANGAYGQPKPAAGILLDTIICQHNPSQGYALYLPNSYRSHQKWPIIFVFDPMARGMHAAKVFTPAAEELGYIVAASNNSRNGSWEIALDAADAMFVDALKRFSIDTDRIYTTGFSGGSRVAMGVAIMSKSVRGVIGCGAGFPDTPAYRPSTGHAFSYVGLVGDRDMNYQEHITVEKELDRIGIKNIRLVFHGIHQWPPPSQIKTALQWLELQAQLLGYNTSDNWNALGTYHHLKHRADSLRKANRLVLAQQAYVQMLDDFEGKVDLAGINKLLTDLQKNKDYKKQLKVDQRLNQKEKNYQHKIGEAFTEAIFTKLNVRNDSSLKGEDWWHKEVDLLKKMAKTSQIKKKNMALRLLNLVWAKFATASFNFTSQGEYDAALLFNKMWLYVEPGSQWAHWSIAKVYAQKGELQQAVEHITFVFKNNNNLPLKLITSEPAFTALLKHPGILEIIGKNNRNKRP